MFLNFFYSVISFCFIRIKLSLILSHLIHKADTMMRIARLCMLHVLRLRSCCRTQAHTYMAGSAPRSARHIRGRFSFLPDHLVVAKGICSPYLQGWPGIQTEIMDFTSKFSGLWAGEGLSLGSRSCLGFFSRNAWLCAPTSWWWDPFHLKIEPLVLLVSMRP